LSSETPAGSGAISAACEVPDMAVKIDAATVTAKIVRIILLLQHGPPQLVPTSALTLPAATKLSRAAEYIILGVL
jgi:hypothetical protein